MKGSVDGVGGRPGENGGKRAEIYTYESADDVYGMNWSVRPPRISCTLDFASDCRTWVFGLEVLSMPQNLSDRAEAWLPPFVPAPRSGS